MLFEKAADDFRKQTVFHAPECQNKTASTNKNIAEWSSINQQADAKITLLSLIR